MTDNVVQLDTLQSARGSLRVWAGDPLKTADQIIRLRLTIDQVSTVVRFEEEWYVYKAPVYRRTTDEEIENLTYRILAGGYCMDKNGNRFPYYPNKRFVSEIVRAINVKISLRGLKLPFWRRENNIGEASEVIVFRDAIINPNTSGRIVPTPAFFTTSNINADYDPCAPTPVHFLEFLQRSIPGEEDRESLLEAIAAMVFGDVQYEKIFLFVGATRSGKSKLANLICDLKGHSNYGGLPANLGYDFALEMALDKDLVVLPDFELGRSVDAKKAANILKVLTGGDNIPVPRKYKSGIIQQSPANILITANKAPDLSDDTDALAARFHAFDFPESFFGREDRDLPKKLASEKSGIINILLERRARYFERGAILDSKASRETRTKLQRKFDPVGTFIQEECEFADDFVPRIELHELYLEKAKREGFPRLDQKAFNKMVRNRFPDLQEKQRIVHPGGNTRTRGWYGLRLRSEK